MASSFLRASSQMFTPLSNGHEWILEDLLQHRIAVEEKLSPVKSPKSFHAAWMLVAPPLFI